MRWKTVLVVAAALAAMLAAAPAHAYNETGTVSPLRTSCDQCHGTSTVSIAGTDTERQGPHAGYLSTTKKCSVCHKVHEAAGGGYSLLPSATVTGTCQTCHDGTGGRGVYGVLLARGVTAASRHRVDSTRTVPGGNPVTGGSSTGAFRGGVGGTLGCVDCHSPHNASTVASFTGDRRRIATDTAGYTSNRLLRRRPAGSVDATQYGSNWCGTCHAGRMRTTGLHNHPSETTAVAGTYFYQTFPRATATSSSVTNGLGLGQNSFGYVWPEPRTAQQAGHFPLCQHCHEDSRHVGDVLQGQLAVTELFQVNSADGTNTADRPRFQVFPHEGENVRFLVETEDDLCTNCHNPAIMP